MQELARLITNLSSTTAILQVLISDSVIVLETHANNLSTWFNGQRFRRDTWLAKWSHITNDQVFAYFGLTVCSRTISSM